MDHLNDLSIDALELLQHKLHLALLNKRAEERRAAVAARRAALAELVTEKNAILVAAGKTRLNAVHLAKFNRWHRREGYAMELTPAFRFWFDATLVGGGFRAVKVPPPKVKYEDLPIEEKIRRVMNIAKHVNLRVVELTARVEEAKVALEAAAGTDQWNIDWRGRVLAKVEDLLVRAKESQRKFAEKHC